jgi:hypothetical protein
VPWFKLDDSFHSHPKVIAAGNEAVGLFVRCGTYAAEHLTDGFIPEDIAVLYGACDTGSRRNPGTGKPETLGETLVRTKLWRRAAKGWRMRDYLDYNPSRKAVDKSRETTARRQRRWQEAQRNGVSNGASSTVTNSAPTRPDPSSTAEVSNPVAGPNTRASPATRIDQIIITEIAAVTGRYITAEWAATVRGHVLDGHHPADPVAYVRQAIRSEPDPSKRFLPQY